MRGLDNRPETLLGRAQNLDLEEAVDDASQDRCVKAQELAVVVAEGPRFRRIHLQKPEWPAGGQVDRDAGMSLDASLLHEVRKVEAIVGRNTAADDRLADFDGSGFRRMWAHPQSRPAGDGFVPADPCAHASAAPCSSTFSTFARSAPRPSATSWQASVSTASRSSECSANVPRPASSYWRLFMWPFEAFAAPASEAAFLAAVPELSKPD